MHRDSQGYGPFPPDGIWPHKAKVAVNFVINYEEGSELTPVNGDEQAEYYGGEFLGPMVKGMSRSLSMESLYDYGSRAGVWRLVRLFDTHQIPVTWFACAQALEKNPALVSYLKHNARDEIAGHGYRWLDTSGFSEHQEYEQIQRCIQSIDELCDYRIQGWYGGRRHEKTREILKGIGGFVYDSDSYGDDLPYYDDDHLIIPYTLVCNDFRFCTVPGFHSPNDFYQVLVNTLAYLLSENHQAIMTIALHPRISGHPARAQALSQFIHQCKTQQNIWLCRRIDIANHWIEQSR